MNIHTSSYGHWTEENKLRASEMWAEGFSAAKIAAAIGGVSRNAIIGIATRNRDIFPRRLDAKGGRLATDERTEAKRFARKGGPPPRAKVEKVVRPARQDMPKAPKIEPIPFSKWAPYDASSLHKPLLNLQAKECKWPVGHDERGHLFCGHEATGSYCTHHKARSVGRGTSEARRKA